MKTSLVKGWVKNVPVEEEAEEQLLNVASLPFIHKHVAAMPDCHWGNGSCVGSVIPTIGAIIPAAVGVDLGCGMMAKRTLFSASDLPDNLRELRNTIEAAVPHGRTANGGKGDRGAWGAVPDRIGDLWEAKLVRRFDLICEKYPKIGQSNHVNHLGTLGTGNHFIEICLDEKECVWVMLHSGSRGVGNRIGSYFIQQAKKEMERYFIQLPDKNLAYLVEGSEYFWDYVEAVSWAQEYARINREIMMDATLLALGRFLKRDVVGTTTPVNCHHNYIAKENHFKKNVWVTRKGAVRARKDELGIIPGSMGAKSFIVRGKGNPDSFTSCSHGAGRAMSRTQARRQFTLEDHVAATDGVECKKDESVLDETPAAYKNIDVVMAAQADLVEIVETLRQVVCVKG
jgi:tRNA-splicing ligase RtcB